MPRARLTEADGEREWRSDLLPASQRRSRRAELLIAQVYLAGINTRRARRALQTLFAGHVGKDAVSRAWRKTHSAWAAWQCRDLSDEDIVRLILGGTVVKVRLDRKATAISLLIVLGVWALLASCQITMRESTAGMPSTAHPPILTSPPEPNHHAASDLRRANFHHLRDTTFPLASAASSKGMSSMLI